MTYQPQESVFGPPLWVRLPSFLYLVASLSVSGMIFLGEQSPTDSWLFRYVVQDDMTRVMSIRTFSVILIVSALASVIRAGMRGVRIYADGIEARDVAALVPKLRRYRWPQIEQIIFDGPRQVAFDLWDGSRAYLPAVGDRDGLTSALEYVAAARAIPVRGGRMLLDEVEHDADEDA